MFTAAARDQSVEGGLMLSLESQRVFQNLLVLFCIITNHLMTGFLGNGEFSLDFVSKKKKRNSRETQFSSSRDQSLKLLNGCLNGWELTNSRI